MRGASLLLAYQLAGKRVLLVGGGAVAASRLGFLLESGAHVTIIAPTLEKSMAYRLSTEPEHVTWIDRPYGVRNPSRGEGFVPEASNTRLEIPSDVDLSLAHDTDYPVSDFDMVLTAIDDNPLSRSICWSCRRLRIPVNVADVPPECDFYFGAQVRRGPLQVMVSTSGAGPKVAVMVRDTLAAAIPDDVEEAIAGVGSLRSELRQRAPGVGGQLSKRRMRWMIDTCNKWSIADMGAMNDPEVRRKLLDDGWEKEVVLGPKDVGPEIVPDLGVWSDIKDLVASHARTEVITGLALGAAVATAGYVLGRRRRR